MKLYRKIFLFLNILFISQACYSPKNCSGIAESRFPEIKPLISLDDNKPQLYHAEFNVLKYHFSGLIAFRRMPEDHEIRIVFLSEMGLRVMEYRYKEAQITNTYCIEPARKKSLLKFIGSFIEILIMDVECHLLCEKTETIKNSYFCRLKKGYMITDEEENKRIYANLNTGRKRKAEGIYSVSERIPDTLNVEMRLNTHIKMKKVSNAFK